MKSALRIAALAPIMLSPLAVANSMPDTYGYIGGHMGHSFYYDNDVFGNDTDGLDNVNFFGGQLGWRFHPKWSVQALYQVVEGDAESKYNSGARLDIRNYYGSIRYHFNNTSLLGFEPYAGLNVGEQEVRFDHIADSDKERELMGGVELGIQRAFADRIILDLGTRHARSEHRDHWEGQVYAGLNLALGARRAAEPVEEVAPVEPKEPAFVDSDGDGVPDHLDRCPNTPAGAVVDSDGCQIYETLDQRETSVIYFGFDRTEITGQFTGEIRGVAERLKAGEDGRIVVEGHTDNTGPSEYNQGLSERRAQAVKDKLIKNYGIDRSSITIRGYGETRPVADNSTADGRSKNRRADIIVETTVKEAQFK